MSHPILRRYTPPTCTLEIRAKNSPLSRWAGQPVLQHVRFELILDDPTIPEEQWITLRGDRIQLEALREAVSTYVQNFLEQSHSYLNAAEVSSAGETIAVLPLSAVTPETVLPATASHSNGIALKPRGLLAHALVLGALATPETGEVIYLSTLRLFDLANALDDYASDSIALPTVQRSRWSTPASSKWGQIAAAGLVVIGLSASVAKIIDSSSKPATLSASQGASSRDQQIATQLPPSAAKGSVPSIASNQKLPPPPPIGSTVPASPGLPTFPLSSPATGLSAGNAPAGTITINPAPNARSQNPATGNQIAMLPNGSPPSGTARARSQAVPPMPKPLTLNREFANAPPPSQSSAAARSSASDSVSQAEAGTAFDTIPQVAEVRRYFQQRWNPSEGLTQTLQYTLLIGANGSIQRAVPLGGASGDYVDRTGIPLVGEPFVSPIRDGRNAKIRLVLSPDGDVKAFLEGFY